MSMTAAQIAKQLGGAKKAGQGWTCKCPAHDDRHNSLSLTEKAGKLLWKCHAGCSQEAVQGELQERGLLEAPAERREPRRRVAGAGDTAKPKPELKPIEGGRRDDADDDRPERDRAAEAEARKRIVATYDYVDIAGQLLFQVVRFQPKAFLQRRPKGRNWEWKLGDTKPIIYRLSEVLAAAGVYIVEGEKDADNLATKFGVIATCSPMGAGKWRPEFGLNFVDKHVVVIPDNDEAGRKHAATVALNCFQCGAASVRWLDLPGLPDHGDVSDWIERGGTKEQLSDLVHDTAKWSPEQPGGNEAWEAGLLVDDDRKPLANEFNLVLALEQAPKLAGRVRYEQFFNRVEARNLPWDITSGDWRPWTDTDTTAFAVWAQKHRININANRSYRPADMVARNHPHHAPRAYLKALKWDQTARIDRWLIDYLGAEPDPQASNKAADDYVVYLKAIGPRFLISAVARVMRPGCKVDTMLVIEGGQGKMKSTAIKLLFGDGEWFSDHISPVGSKDSKEELAGKWCIEVSELSALQRADVEKIKAFLSTAVDNYRPSYGHLPRAFPRQCVFFGSTNEDAYLRDATGGRRFWPFKAGHIDLENLRKDRDQLWAEATHRFHANEPWHLTVEEEALAGAEQKDRIEPDAWGDVFDAWAKVPENAPKLEKLTIRHVLEGIGIPKDRWDQRAQNRAAALLKLRGWVKRRKYDDDGKRIWAYELE